MTSNLASKHQSCHLVVDSFQQDEVLKVVAEKASSSYHKLKIFYNQILFSCFPSLIQMGKKGSFRTRKVE